MKRVVFVQFFLFFRCEETNWEPKEKKGAVFSQPSRLLLESLLMFDERSRFVFCFYVFAELIVMRETWMGGSVVIRPRSPPNE